MNVIEHLHEVQDARFEGRKNIYIRINGRLYGASYRSEMGRRMALAAIARAAGISNDEIAEAAGISELE